MRPTLLVLAALCALPAHSQSGVVDDQRLANAQHDTRNWLSYGRDYSNQRFSPLIQINSGNVAQLAPAWSFKTGLPSTFQASPIVVDGVMYVALPFNHVVALDARTGT